jgi:hypothetical protein
MSDFDGGYDGHDAGDTSYDSAHQDAALDHDQAQYGSEHDANADHDAYGQEHNAETDEHFANGHHVEADTPQSHYSETDFTNADAHAQESDASFGEHDASNEHDANFSELEHLQEQFQADATHFQSGFEGDGGHENLSIANN